MYCPSCLAESRPGFTRCPDCDVDLVTELPSGDEALDIDDGSHDVAHVGPDAVQVYAAYRDIEAEMLRSVLEDAGITVALFRGGIGAYAPGIPAEVRVMVPRDQAEDAIEAIRGALEGDNALGDEPES